jgi:hypothetical protein
MAKVKMHEMFPSKWLSAADLEGGELEVTVSAISYEKVKQMNGDGVEEKMALHFHNQRGKKPLKPMLLNKVNLTTLIVLFGDDDEDWTSQKVKIGVDMVPVGKEVKPGLRIRTWRPESKVAPTVTKSNPKSQPRQEPAEQPTDGGQVDSDLPF